MRYKKSIFYINFILFIVAVLFTISTFSLPGHELIYSALAAIGPITGEGNTNFLARFVGAVDPSNQIGNSTIFVEEAGVGVEHMRITSSGNVGIGVTTPAATLSVYNTTGADITLQYDGQQRWWFSADQPGLLKIGGNGASRPATGAINIDSNGNVGIGMIGPPGARLDVSVGTSQCCASQTPNISLAQASITNGNMSWLQFHNAGESEAYIRLAGGGTGLRAGQRRLEIGDSQGITTGLTVTGNVGIGTTNPVSRLEVTHNGASTWGTAIRINQDVVGNSDGPKLEFYKTMTTPKRWSVGILNGLNVDDFVISEDGGISGFGSPRLTILNGGNVGIGTTTPQIRLQVQGGHYNSRIRLFSDEYGQGIDGVNTGIFSLWTSEPGVTWNGIGIGNNIQNYEGGVGGSFPRITTTRGGSYIRLLDNAMYLNVVDSIGVDRNGITINNSAYVGIGTTSPAAKLSVNGGIELGSRIYPGSLLTEGGWSLVHFKGGTVNEGGIVRASQGTGDAGNAPLRLQSSYTAMDSPVILIPRPDNPSPLFNGMMWMCTNVDAAGNCVP